jgi:hypothetical protein
MTDFLDSDRGKSPSTSSTEIPNVIIKDTLEGNNKQLKEIKEPEEKNDFKEEKKLEVKNPEKMNEKINTPVIVEKGVEEAPLKIIEEIPVKVENKGDVKVELAEEDTEHVAIDEEDEDI